MFKCDGTSVPDEGSIYDRDYKLYTNNFGHTKSGWHGWSGTL
jgi:hypothetical protein